MALAAGTSAAGLVQGFIHIVPVLRVRVDPQAAKLCTVAFQTDIAFRVAGLAGGQVLARLARMVD